MEAKKDNLSDVDNAPGRVETIAYDTPPEQDNGGIDREAAGYCWQDPSPHSHISWILRDLSRDGIIAVALVTRCCRLNGVMDGGLVYCRAVSVPGLTIHHSIHSMLLAIFTDS